eukprot:CAMPEP_0116952558 /NCGR_PEP_ID=MMETSP0467-20121206/40820_1 /TAXON_ID=283647 /ORGANISM="Mesodinium pulex, Strain SPMC105" /LENGTH=42 /DNA_ID= /DNA_START= /DNA_END= /DNA_ORIENTATION=
MPHTKTNMAITSTCQKKTLSLEKNTEINTKPMSKKETENEIN